MRVFCDFFCVVVDFSFGTNEMLLKVSVLTLIFIMIYTSLNKETLPK